MVERDDPILSDLETSLRWSTGNSDMVEVDEEGRVLVRLPEWWRIPEGQTLIFCWRNSGEEGS